MGMGKSTGVGRMKGHEGTFWGDGNVLYHVLVAVTQLHIICQHSSNCILKIGEFLFLSKLYLKYANRNENIMQEEKVR